MANTDKKLKKTVEMIIEDAERYLKKSKDDKYFLQAGEFLMILQMALKEGIGPGEGAIRLNRLQDRMSNYAHDIIYKGINFITATPKKIKVDYE